jgi:hypothetical protein
MSTCAVVMPIYKSHLSSNEIFSVKRSLSNLIGHDVYWVAPASLNISEYQFIFGPQRIKRFPDCYFESISDYNRLLVGASFYESFLDYDFILVCQTDAVVLKPELHLWLDMPYDYVGAPWPQGYSLTIKTKRIPIEAGVVCTAFVGNGGLSLRRTRACIDLIEEFDDLSASWHKDGHAEDLFFAFAGTLSFNFLIPNIITAANFSYDIDPVYLHKLAGNRVPFGIHAWEKYDLEFCKSVIDPSFT